MHELKNVSKMHCHCFLAKLCQLSLFLVSPFTYHLWPHFLHYEPYLHNVKTRVICLAR